MALGGTWPHWPEQGGKDARNLQVLAMPPTCLMALLQPEQKHVFWQGWAVMDWAD